MVWFTGTSTGNKYTVGALYERNGEKYRANVDGSFTKLSTGKVSVGSSQSRSVQWGGFGSTRARSSSGQSSPTRGVGAAVVGSSPSAGPGATGAGLVAVVDGFRLPIAVTPLDTQSGLSVQLGESTRTPIQVGGNWLTLDAGWSDGGDVEQRWGEAEVFSPGWFYNWGVAIADLYQSSQPGGVGYEGVKAARDKIKAIGASSNASLGVSTPQNWVDFNASTAFGVP